MKNNSFAGCGIILTILSFLLLTVAPTVLVAWAIIHFALKYW